MRHLTTTALAVVLAGALGAMSLAPAAFADAAAPGAAMAAPAAPGETPARTDMPAAHGMMKGGPGMMMRGHMGKMGGNLLDMACGDRGAEALEIAFVRMHYAVKPTAEQAPLLDALRTTALADQKTFADACKTAMKQDGTGKANLLDRLETRLAIDTAKVTALNDVMPKFKAFYDSLTAEQQARLEPHRWGSHVGMGGHPGWNHAGPGARGPMGHMNGHRLPQPPDTATPAPAPADDAPSDSAT